MQVIELLKLIEWFKTHISDTGIINKYAALHSKMSQNIRRNGYGAVPFDKEKEDLFDSIQDICFQNLSLEQIKLLGKLKVVNLLGEKGVVEIKNILTDNNLDIVAATSKIQNLSSIINNAQSRVTNINNSLKDLFIENEADEINIGNVLIRIYFKDGVAIDTLTKFKQLSAKWYEIGRGIAMARDKTPDDFKIITVERGSVIVTMSVIAGMAYLISKILLDVLKIVDKFLDIMKKCEEIKNFKLNNEQIARDLHKETEDIKKEGAKDILKSVIEELKLNSEQQGDKVAVLKKSIDDLINFTENGGGNRFCATR
jgi:hypothetical protein